MRYRVKLTLEDGSSVALLSDEDVDLLCGAELERVQSLVVAVRQGTTRFGYNQELGGITTALAWQLDSEYAPDDLVLATAVEVEPVEVEKGEVVPVQALSR